MCCITHRFALLKLGFVFIFSFFSLLFKWKKKCEESDLWKRKNCKLFGWLLLLLNVNVVV